MEAGLAVMLGQLRVDGLSVPKQEVDDSRPAVFAGPGEAASRTWSRVAPISVPSGVKQRSTRSRRPTPAAASRSRSQAGRGGPGRQELRRRRTAVGVAAVDQRRPGGAAARVADRRAARQQEGQQRLEDAGRHRMDAGRGQPDGRVVVAVHLRRRVDVGAGVEQRRGDRRRGWSASAGGSPRCRSSRRSGAAWRDAAGRSGPGPGPDPRSAGGPASRDCRRRWRPPPLRSGRRATADRGAPSANAAKASQSGKKCSRAMIAGASPSA